jgi:hypothetical protein
MVIMYEDNYAFIFVVLGAIMLIELEIGLKVRRFKPGRDRWIFKGDKYP